MPTTAMNTLRAALALAPIVLSLAAAPASAVDQMRLSVSGVRYGIAPALDCNQTGKTAPQGSWVEANGAAVEGGPPRRVHLSFGEPVATDTFRTAMNGEGTRDLALVEFQGTDGAWHKAWEGELGAPNANFAQTCFEQRLPEKQVVQALRYTFRAGPGQVDLNHAALLRR